MHYRLFIFLFFGIMGLLISLTFAFNLYKDHAYIFDFFRQNKLKEIAQNINNGKNLVGHKNINDRSFQKYLIETQNKIPEIIAIGSSRIKQINQAHFSGKYFFNHGMGNAGIEDYYGIIGKYLQTHHKLPAVIIFGLDPWIFNTNVNPRFLDLKEEILFLQKVIQQPSENKLVLSDKSWIFKIKELISLQYTYENIKQLLNSSPNTNKIQNTCNPSEACLKPDGSFIEPKHILKRTQADITRLSQQYIQGFQVHQLGGFDQLHPDAFLELMDFLQKLKIRIIFYLPPYHPIVYDFLFKTPKYKQVFKAQDFIKRYAGKHNIPTLGDYNPKTLKIKENDFLDGMHLKPDPNNRIFEQFFKEKDLF